MMGAYLLPPSIDRGSSDLSLEIALLVKNAIYCSKNIRLLLSVNPLNIFRRVRPERPNSLYGLAKATGLLTLLKISNKGKLSEQAEAAEL